MLHVNKGRWPQFWLGDRCQLKIMQFDSWYNNNVEDECTLVSEECWTTYHKNSEQHYCLQGHQNNILYYLIQSKKWQGTYSSYPELMCYHMRWSTVSYRFRTSLAHITPLPWIHKASHSISGSASCHLKILLKWVVVKTRSENYMWSALPTQIDTKYYYTTTGTS